MSGIAGRHPAVTSVLEWFSYEHLREGLPKDVSRAVAALAHEVTNQLHDDPELTAGLRHLLEAKDAFVRAAIRTERNRP